MPISAVDSISLAFEHTKQQLFKPFRFWQWTKLALVGLLAGELGSGSGFNGSNMHFPSSGGGGNSPFPSLPGVDFAVLGALITVIVIAGLALALIFMYIGSVMRFILFDSIIARECNIRAGWSRRQGPGWRLFLWKLGYTVLSLLAFAALIGIPAAFAYGLGWFHEPKEHLLPLILGGIILFFALIVLIVVLAVIFVMTKDFVVPQMALENIGAVEGWRRLWTMMEAEKGAYAVYIGMKILLAIGAGIAIGIATIILGLFIAIPAIGLSILAVVTGKSAGLTWNAYTITLAIVVGSVLLSIFLYLVSLISVPVIVFFPAYSMYFFAARYRPLSAALYSAAPDPAIAAPYSPPVLPPLPPHTEPAG